MCSVLDDNLDLQASAIRPKEVTSKLEVALSVSPAIRAQPNLKAALLTQVPKFADLPPRHAARS